MTGRTRRSLVSTERAFSWLLRACAAVSVGVTVAMFVVLVREAWGFFDHVPLAAFLLGTEWTPLFTRQAFGVIPLLSGTLLVAAIALACALPVGGLAGLYLSEFASDRVRLAIMPVLETVTTVPTVLYGLIALFAVTPLLQQVWPELPGFSALSTGVMLGCLLTPLVSTHVVDSLQHVPAGQREAAFALGSTRWETTARIVIPAARRRLWAVALFVASRAIGDTMIATIAAGQQARVTANPFQPVQTLSAYIVQRSQGDTPVNSLAWQTMFATGALLFVVTFALNAAVERLRSVPAGGQR